MMIGRNVRFFSVMGRDTADLSSKILKRITPKFTQKPLGSYPFPPEHEMVWKNRRTVLGGYFQQSISPFQLKFVYPVIHQAPARMWAKLSQAFWWVIWPTLMAYVGFLTIKKLDKKYIKRHNYF
ncbi:putative integral membrane protein [Theileria parva strain Muguga]|uniref:Cytochrome b-c1 complex subunit 8 n=1 Tax=Theileria parva TaxID=5875 RepID=Q4N8Z1_THEPA|nr:putative integral membrane protein [Theileria parva strain Muguga]EAN33567.1 putative integral membrane protein [Theileria parva strain Muguga]|eukprot:XP_765850.1 hypothetical protein [Theileria parva strain Muguga]